MAKCIWRKSIAVAVGAISLVASGAPAVAGGQPGRPDGRLAIESVSNPRPDLVSGGQVLLRITSPSGGAVRVTANGQDVTANFAGQTDGSMLGLVAGLRDGTNTIGAQLAGHHGADQHTTLRVTNHPITGPVFSGHQQVPFFCETQVFGLAPAVQPLCSAPTQVSYQYKTTAGAFAPLADPASRPADLASATVGGRSVPYIVRIERGTIDRAVYEIAALYDGSDPSPLVPDTSWNRRLVYTFGGGCNAGYHQGRSTGGVVNDLFLAQGYAVASSSLNVLDNNCSPIISAEAAMMVKEHFIETYGPVAHTIGWGGSGGAIQQYDIAENYPGIVDGIVPGVSFPDPLSTAGPVTDCRLLDRYFAGPGAALTPAQRVAVAGFADYETCVSWDQTFASRSTATDSCDSSIPVAIRWDPVTNPNGLKCNSNEQLVNQFGRDPRTGFVRSVLDNTGVQYGLGRAAGRADHPGRLRGAQRGNRRSRLRRPARRRTHGGRPEGARRGLPRRHRQQRLAGTARYADHRPAHRPRLRRIRQRHPHHGVVVHHARSGCCGPTARSATRSSSRTSRPPPNWPRPASSNSARWTAGSPRSTPTRPRAACPPRCSPTGRPTWATAATSRRRSGSWNR